ncbi:MAG: hypothetical protein NWE89_05395 [Candidatus Bathyarchaeota archaeon]|nr:hypothetical protein [Candidatus Bathyarchaeota archaeon]
MSIIKDYIESAGGNFRTAKNTSIDDTVTIAAVWLDDESFDKSYVVVDATLDSTSEEVKVRLGVQNLERIAETLGDDEATWSGQKLRCIGTQKYPGLGTQGLLWRGIAVSPGGSTVVEPVLESSSNLKVIVAKILAAKPQMTAEAVQKLIDEEKEKAGGLITDEAAAFLVSSSLGVDLKK